MDWNKAIILGGQSVAFVGLAVLVALDHDSVITDALLAVTGSIAGVGIINTFAKKQPPAE